MNANTKLSSPTSIEHQQDLWEKDLLEAVLEHKWEDVHQYLHEADCVDEDNWTTLHWSCREYYTPLDTIQLLLNAYPLAATHQDINGSIPLHIALEYSKPIDVIESLVESCPSTLHMVDAKGRTPLHVACIAASNTPLKIVEFLVKEYPDAALKKDCLGKTPLTEVICNKLEDEVIDVLLRHCPDCIALDTPLHLSVSCSRSVGTMRSLVKCQPKLLLAVNQKKQAAEDLFYSKWDRPLTKFIESIPSSANPSDIWNNKTNFDNFPTQYVYDTAIFFLNHNNETNSNSTLHSAIKSQKCPWSFCELFLRLHPNEFIKYNSDGISPIELISNSSKRKFYEPRLLQRTRIINQLRKNCKDFSKEDDSKHKALLRFLQQTTKSNCEELKMMNFLYYSIRENPVICANKKRKLN